MVCPLLFHENDRSVSSEAVILSPLPSCHGNKLAFGRCFPNRGRAIVDHFEAPGSICGITVLKCSFPPSIYNGKGARLQQPARTFRTAGVDLSNLTGFQTFFFFTLLALVSL